MEKPKKTNELEKIPLSVVNFSDEDLTPIETKDGIQSIIDLKQIKLKRGNEFVSLHDQKLGLEISVQSFKRDVSEVASFALQLLDKMKEARKQE